MPDHRERLERQKRAFVLAQRDARKAPRSPALLPPEKTIEKLKVPSHLKLVRNQASRQASTATGAASTVASASAPTSSGSAVPTADGVVSATAASCARQVRPDARVSLVAYDDSDSEGLPVEDEECSRAAERL